MDIIQIVGLLCSKLGFQKECIEYFSKSNRVSNNYKLEKYSYPPPKKT